MYRVTRGVTPVTRAKMPWQETIDPWTSGHGPPNTARKGPRDPGTTARLTEGTKGNEVLAVTGFFIIRNKCVSPLCMGSQKL